ncbi:DUF7126 family protein [Halopenitus persicus]|uniref:DUF7126 family protein n=1 Tax=Halopenitus persicus TaxID=1048396 RepID=UPI000BBA7971|nr:CTP synthetase [Halopenitus persicus]
MAADTYRAIVAGPDDHDLAGALAAVGAAVTRIDDVVSAAALREAGIDAADLLVITDVEEATGIPIAKEENPDVRTVTYADRSLPEFVAGVADLAVDPALLDAETVAAELVDAERAS